MCSSDAWPYKLDRHGNPIFVRPSQDWQSDAAQRPLSVYYRVDRESIVDLESGISEIGAVYVSAGAHDGWDALVHARAKKPPPWVVNATDASACALGVPVSLAA